MLLNFTTDGKSNTTVSKIDGITVLWNNGKTGQHEVMFIGHSKKLHPATGLPTTLFVAEVKDSFKKVNSNDGLFLYANNPLNIEVKSIDKDNPYEVYLSNANGGYDMKSFDYPLLVGLDNYHNFKSISSVLES